MTNERQFWMLSLHARPDLVTQILITRGSLLLCRANSTEAWRFGIQEHTSVQARVQSNDQTLPANVIFTVIVEKNNRQ